MKRIYILLAFIAILFSSCGTYSEMTYVFDYTDHEDKSFIISPPTPSLLTQNTSFVVRVKKQ